MEYRTGEIILRAVTEEDIAEVARTWPADHHPLSEAEARDAIASMRGNSERNAKGRLCHLCLAVCRADEPRVILGWCGLDGRRSHTEPEIFILLDAPYRGRGYGTMCVKELLRIATDEFSLPGVHGGCDRHNIASRRAMEKGGMAQYGTEENGDPLFRFRAGPLIRKGGIQMPDHQKIVILDFGGQYTQLIARRVRENRVFSEVVPWNVSVEDVRAKKPVGVILSGGPSSVHDADAPRVDPAIYALGVPVLGICYGMQLTAHLLGGRVEKAAEREYGRVTVRMKEQAGLLEGMSEKSSCWMSHTWQVVQCPPGFHPLAETDNCPVAAMANEERRVFGVQFHPEVTHTDEGKRLIRNFLYNICGCVGDWTMDAYAETAVQQIRDAVGENGTVLLALSGGVDSSVAAALIYRAIGKRLTCVFVDHGLLRKGESGQVCHVFSHLFPVRFIRADASDKFFADLKGVTEPEEKRHIIGRDFIEVFREEAAALGKLDYFAQGTIYPDVIESGQGTNAAVIKSHHNVGGLPKELGFTELIEPLRMLFKDEVRALGEALGLPRELVWRQPFPGPGLAIRVIGEVTRDKVEIVRESDAIFREEITRAGLERRVNQYFTVLTGVHSVGVMGDERTYDYTVALRAVTTDDFMTADWARLPYDLIAAVSARIVNEVPHASRVVLDVTTKPPASIEWE